VLMEPEQSVNPPASPGVRHAVEARYLRPYVSILVLEVTNEQARERVFRALTATIGRSQERSRSSVEEVANGLRGFDTRDQGGSYDEIGCIVWRRQRAPSWATEDSPYVDVDHELSLCLRRSSLIAVLASPSVEKKILKWVDKEPRPELRRVPRELINASFLKNPHVKNMWLKNIHSRSASRPDSKAMSGVSLKSALDPIGDGSFVLGSARVEISEDDSRVSLRGVVGTTPRNAKIWTGPTADVREFNAIVTEIMELIQQGVDSNDRLSSPYPSLANQVDDLDGVQDAFEFRYVAPASLDPGEDVADERHEAALRLEQTTIDAEPIPGSADVILNVGLDESISGKLRACVTAREGRVRVTIGHEGEGTDPGTVCRIRDDINLLLSDFTIHYTSGHTIADDAIYREQQQTTAFNGWMFQDFSGFRVDREKPPGQNPEEIHANIAVDGDDSLFSWVVKTFSEGALLCDDGPGEIADFLHVADDGKLSFIHVKSARSASPRRKVALPPYEVVVSQAVKNLVNLDPGKLSERISASQVVSPAAWKSGERIAGRGDFLESLACRDARDVSEVVIVQPHLTFDRHKLIRGEAPDSVAPDAHRLRLLDTILNSALMSCINSNALFTVIGSR
jgi:hypothetical protein